MTLKSRIVKLEGGHGDGPSHFGTVYTISIADGMARSEYAFNEHVKLRGGLDIHIAGSASLLTPEKVHRIVPQAVYFIPAGVQHGFDGCLLPAGGADSDPQPHADHRHDQEHRADTVGILGSLGAEIGVQPAVDARFTIPL